MVMSELRRDSITGRWVILAPERTRRAQDFTPAMQAFPPMRVCPFCEGQEALAGREVLAWRPEGSAPNGPGWEVRVVPNREPILQVESALGDATDGMFQRFGNLGANEVIIESPRHDAKWTTLAPESLMRVFWAWRERIRDLKRDSRLRSFVIVKSRGAAAGAKLEHPHSQLFAYPFAPPGVEIELAAARRHYDNVEHCVYCDLIARELDLNQRIVSADEHTLTLAPFAPRLPFETWILPRAHAAQFEDTSDALLLAVAHRVQDVVRRFDAILQRPPLNFVLHTAPDGRVDRLAYHWHMEIVPRLGPASGVEWGSGVYVNPVPPEEAVEALRGARPASPAPA
jgi:UDPglucose--hexose-1-phosphate uridylyltransferase